MPSYFAFVRRTGHRRYSATFPDLGDLTAFARGPRQLAAAAVAAARRIGFARAGVVPHPTGLRDLPRMADEANGYWLLIDLADALPCSREDAERPERMEAEA